jgi:hypothetical protein
MKKIILLAMVIGLLVSGCTKHYIAGVYPIPDELLKTRFTSKLSVTLINRYGDKPLPALIGQADPYTFYGDLKQMTDTLVTLLSQELSKRGMVVRDNGEKIIQLQVKSMVMAYHFTNRTTITVNVTTTNGYSRDFAETNSSMMYQKSFDGAITKAVAAILNDEDIINYLVQ